MRHHLLCRCTGRLHHGVVQQPRLAPFVVCRAREFLVKNATLRRKAPQDSHK